MRKLCLSTGKVIKNIENDYHSPDVTMDILFPVLRDGFSAPFGRFQLFLLTTDCLRDQGKLKAESEVGIGCWECIGNKRIIHCMVRKDLKVETVAKDIVSSYSDDKNIHPCNWLVDIFHKLPCQCFVIPERYIEP